MLIIGLLVITVLLLMIVYKMTDKDIMNPAVIFSAVYVVSIGCAVINIERWNINMSWKTFAYLLLGAVEFTAISVVMYRYCRKKYCLSPIPFAGKGEEDENKTEVCKWLIGAICGYSTIAIMLMVYEILKIAMRFGEFSTFSEALTLYKNHASYSIQAQLPGYVTIAIKPIAACAYVMLFLFLKKLAADSNKIQTRLKECWYYLLPVVLYILQRLLESNRGAVIDFVLSGVTMFFIIWYSSHDWKSHVTVKTMLKLAIIAGGGLILFYFSASLVGRINSKGMFEYITYYCGGSIECFNRYLQNPPPKLGIWGGETFYHLIVNLDSLGITDFNLQSLESGHFEFQYHNDIMIGNIYTAYRRWIQDFGVMGAVILQGIMAVFFSGFYQMIRWTRMNTRKRDFLIIVYSYLAYCIYLHPIDGYFYFEILSKASAATLIMLFVIYWVVYHVKKR